MFFLVLCLSSCGVAKNNNTDKDTQSRAALKELPQDDRNMAII